MVILPFILNLGNYKPPTNALGLARHESPKYAFKYLRTTCGSKVYPELSERFLRWALKQHYKALGYKVSMRRIRLGNTEIDGEAIGPEAERIAIEIKTPRDDLARGIGQLAEALAFGYRKAVLVTTLKKTGTIDDSVFKRFGFGLIGVDSHGNIHVVRYKKNTMTPRTSV